MTSAQWQLDSLTAEIESYVAAAGWDQLPRLFALAHTPALIQAEPALAASLGLTDADADADAQSLTPIEQEDLPEGDLEQLLAQIAWPPAVLGCALSQEIVFLPPELEAELDAELDDESAAARVAGHPLRREARLVVSVLRDGSASSMLRLRSSPSDDVTGAESELLAGDRLAPNLVQALLATFEED